MPVKEKIKTERKKDLRNHNRQILTEKLKLTDDAAV